MLPILDSRVRLRTEKIRRSTATRRMYADECSYATKCIRQQVCGEHDKRSQESLAFGQEEGTEAAEAHLCHQREGEKEIKRMREEI